MDEQEGHGSVTPRAISTRDARVTCRGHHAARRLFRHAPPPLLAAFEMAKEIRDYLTKQLFIEKNIVCSRSSMRNILV